MDKSANECSKEIHARGKVLQFSTEFKSKSQLQLFDDNQRVKQMSRAHAYILADIEAVTTGKRSIKSSDRSQ